jgi:hypothetical protein
MTNFAHVDQNKGNALIIAMASAAVLMLSFVGFRAPSKSVRHRRRSDGNAYEGDCRGLLPRRSLKVN